MSAHGVFYKKAKSKSTFFYLFCVLLVLFVALNIISSQRYNRNMYGVMEGESDSIVAYLKHVWGSALFPLEIETYKANGRFDILSKWETVKQTNTKRIQNLEKAVILYPYSPELYYNLHLLYLENGDRGKAIENLHKAQAIDPNLR